MDELDAAASVLAMDDESEAEEDMVQDGNSGASGGDDEQPPVPEQPVAGAEGEGDLPERQRVGTDDQKVWCALEL